MPRTRSEQITMDDEALAEFLATSWSGVAGTIGPAGVPHLATVSYGLHAGQVVFSSYSKAQKIVNLQRDPRLSFLVEDLGGGYGDIRGTLLRGTAELVTEPPLLVELMTAVIAHSRRNGRPSDGESLQPHVVAKRTAVLLRVEKTISWDHRALAGSY